MNVYQMLLKEDEGRQKNRVKSDFPLFVTCIIQGDLKIMQSSIPDTCSVCQKMKYIEIRKQKNNVI
jgi:hypothetical protein